MFDLNSNSNSDCDSNSEDKREENKVDQFSTKGKHMNMISDFLSDQENGIFTDSTEEDDYTDNDDYSDPIKSN